MATLFLEPGGDSTFDTSLWPSVQSAPTIVSDFVHGGHLRSTKYATSAASTVVASNFASDTGGRMSFWLYLNHLPAASANILRLAQTGDGAHIVNVMITTAGILQLVGTAQIGSNGATLATGAWNQITFAWTITSLTVNQFRLFVNNTSSISVSNATLGNVTSKDLELGNSSADTTLDMRTSDHYIDSSTALTDVGVMWVTAKRPLSNGTTNGFTTQIGSGGSGYGSGHAPQVNERPLSTTNGWSMVGAGSAITEEYTIEGESVGDIDISAGTLIDYMGWVYAKALVSETAQIIVSGVSTGISLTSTNTMFRHIAGSTTYPAGGTDIGVTTSTALTTVSLYEAGIAVAYIPGTAVVASGATALLMGV